MVCLGFFFSSLELVRILFIGDVVYLHLFGQGLIFLNSPNAVMDLMERRSVIYSDRAPLVMATELFVPCVDLHSPTADV
jgi:chorismate-pyruvate lyase